MFSHPKHPPTSTSTVQGIGHALTVSAATARNSSGCASAMASPPASSSHSVIPWGGPPLTLPGILIRTSRHVLQAATIPMCALAQEGKSACRGQRPVHAGAGNVRARKPGTAGSARTLPSLSPTNSGSRSSLSFSVRVGIWPGCEKARGAWPGRLMRLAARSDALVLPGHVLRPLQAGNCIHLRA